jgi:hypothetical protein
VNASSTPLVDCFRQGEAPRDVRLMAARGGFPLSVGAQLSLLMLLASDADPEVKAAVAATIRRLPPAKLAAVLAIPDCPADLREFYGAWMRDDVAPQPPAQATPPDAADAQAAAAPWVDPAEDVGGSATPEATNDLEPPSVEAGDAMAGPGDAPERRGAAQRLALLTVSDRMKVAMQGSREERQVLIRDPNRLVSAAVLSSPKLTESEIEAIARMTNVSADVLRTVGTNRVWLKNYAVLSALTRNAKTPIAVSLNLVNRLTERDIRFLSSDRNVPEPVRLAARKIYSRSVARR